MAYISALAVLSMSLGLVSSQSCSASLCASQAPIAQNTSGASRTIDHLYIGGLFGIHEAGSSELECSEKIRQRGIMNLEAFLYAVRTLRTRQPGILQNMEVRAFAFDSCSSVSILSQQVLNIENCVVSYGSPAVEPERVLAYVGPDRSNEVRYIMPAMDKKERLVVSPVARGGDLSDSNKYAFFKRTIPSEAVEIKAIIKLITDMKWSYVQVVYVEGHHGLSAVKMFERGLNGTGVCITQALPLPQHPEHAQMEDVITKLVQNGDSRVVVILANDNHARAMLEAAKTLGIRNTLTYVGSATWGRAQHVVQGLEEYAEGAISLAHKETTDGKKFIEEFKKLKPGNNNANPWFNEYWQQHFDCYLPGSTPIPNKVECDVDRQNLDDATMDAFVPATIRAVDIILKAVNEAVLRQCLNNDGLCSNFLKNRGRGSTILRYVENAEIGGDRLFKYGNNDYTMANFDFVQLNRRGAQYEYDGIGSYDSRQEKVALTPDIKMKNITTSCAPPCDVCSGIAPVTVLPPDGNQGNKGGSPTPTPVPQAPNKLRSGGWVIALLVLASLGIVLVIAFEIYIMSKIIGTPFVKHWGTMWLGQLLLFAVLLCYLTLFAFVPSPTAASCTIIRLGIGCSYAMCFAVLLVKLMIILSSENIGYLRGIYQFLMFVFAWGVQIAVDVEWLVFEPAEAIDPDKDGVWVCRQGFAPHVKSLVYVMGLIAVNTIISIRAHGIITNHREGIFIGMASGFSIPIWIAWVLLGFLKNDPEWHDPIIAFALFVNATIILFTMFLPKVRQLNSMGVEGIYAEDDKPDATAVVQTGSMMGGSAMLTPGGDLGGSVMYAPQKIPDEGSIILVNGGAYADPGTIQRQEALRATPSNPNALHLAYPARSDSGSLRSVPIGGGNLTLLRPANNGLQMTNDLAGRQRHISDQRSHSDYRVPVNNHGYPPPSSSGSRQGPHVRQNDHKRPKQGKAKGHKSGQSKPVEGFRSYTDIGSL